MKTLKPSYWNVLRRIQDSIPKELTERVTKKAPLAPTIKEVIERGLADPKVSPEIKHKLQVVKDSGYLDKEIEVEDPEITKQIDEFVEKEIEKAVLRGELPKGKKGRNLAKKLKRLNEAKQ
jgi:hypothetical protein